MAPRLRIEIEGMVQGVGFRPCVYALATGMGLAGFVVNTSSGVAVEVEGEGAEGFPDRLIEGIPPLASVTRMRVLNIAPTREPGFVIKESIGDRGFTLISPDVSTCPDCIGELTDPEDRRYGYPFINCTNCGPRFSITLRVPYDRANTTMAPFVMCPECASEYMDPRNRRFHAEPNACPACGPRVTGHGYLYEGIEDHVQRSVELIREGRVIGIKGLGGFHICCDALNPEAVERLRRAKRNNNKPFALMAGDVETIRLYCRVSPEEEALLRRRERPIVLLERATDRKQLPEDVAPGVGTLGFMLPYTPLHHLLLREPGAVYVMTSGNRAEQPIEIENHAAMEGLGGLCDAFLTHDREIFMRADDSVVRVMGAPRAIRRARGYTPAPITLAGTGPDTLSTGADLKCAFTITRGGMAIMSQHIGDMQGLGAMGFFEEALGNLTSVYGCRPEALAHDLHPGYLTTEWAMRQPLPRLAVQHHHAHIASVMAEHGLADRVIGLAMDGTGYGPDGTLWGGEVLVADGTGYERVGRLGHLKLPGGGRAILEPWRTAVGLIGALYGEGAPEVLDRLGFSKRHSGSQGALEVLRVAGLGEFSPISSGLGRAFDAVAALTGVCSHNTYEGEAAIRLEAAASEGLTGAYGYEIAWEGNLHVLDLSTAYMQITGDLLAKADVGGISTRFHNTVIAGLCEMARTVSRETGILEVALSGGAFQNARLLMGITQGLEAMGMDVYSNSRVPLGDGGISLGQAYVLRSMIRKGIWTPQ